LFASGCCVIDKFVVRVFDDGCSGDEISGRFCLARGFQVIEGAKPNDEKERLEPRYKVRFIEEALTRLMFDVKEI
jgi:hypothetical protein